MGANYQSGTLKAGTPAEAITKIERAIAQAKIENGTDAYSGTISTCRGASIVGRTFDNFRAADGYFEEHAQKWGPVLVAPLKDRPGVFAYGAWCAE